MLDVLYGILALILCLAGVFGVYEYRSYTDAQRARTPLLSRSYLGCAVLMVLAGTGGVMWLLRGGTVWAVSGVLILISALPGFVQFLWHRKLDLDQSPLADRVSAAIARKFNVPER